MARLPGIGQRTAQRLAFHLLRVSDEEALALADAIREVKRTVRRCEICFNLATEPTCRICQDERRDADVICVVEEPSDVIPIERTNEFSGRYHVLGGALSPIDGVDPEDLHIGELLERASSNGVREVVVATNATTTGEATALYLADALRERAPGRDGDAPGERAAGGRGPRVRRRGHARAQPCAAAARSSARLLDQPVVALDGQDPAHRLVEAPPLDLARCAPRAAPPHRRPAAPRPGPDT